MATAKNMGLVADLNKNISNMCGVGTRFVKLFLNAKVKRGDKKADLYRKLLECECLNANAKKYRNTFDYSYHDSYYYKKSEMIETILRGLMFDNPLKIEYGWAVSDVPPTRHVVYFDSHLFGQISFHNTLSQSILNSIPKYTKKWDCRVNSTFHKLEFAIDRDYGDEIREKYKDSVKENNLIASKSRIDNEIRHYLFSCAKNGIEGLLDVPAEYRKTDIGFIPEKKLTEYRLSLDIIEYLVNNYITLTDSITPEKLRNSVENVCNENEKIMMLKYFVSQKAYKPYINGIRTSDLKIMDSYTEIRNGRNEFKKNIDKYDFEYLKLCYPLMSASWKKAMKRTVCRTVMQKFGPKGEEVSKNFKRKMKQIDTYVELCIDIIRDNPDAQQYLEMLSFS